VGYNNALAKAKQMKSAKLDYGLPSGDFKLAPNVEQLRKQLAAKVAKDKPQVMPVQSKADF
jgi:hypothetical protein